MKTVLQYFRGENSMENEKKCAKQLDEIKNMLLFT